MNLMGTEQEGGQEEGAGPVWGRFFDSIGDHHDHDNESVISGSHLHHEASTPPPGSQSFSEIHPDDSASAIDDEHISLHGGARYAGAGAVATLSTVESSKAAPVPVDDGTYVFKFSTPSGRTHRFQARNDHYENLREIITGKLSIDPFITAHKDSPDGPPRPDPNDYHLAYVDSDGDTVYITQDTDVQDAVKLSRSRGIDRVVLYVHGGTGWDLASVPAPPPPAPEPVVEKKAEAPPPPPVLEEEKLFGVLAKEHILPASIAFLGVVVVTVFTISRLTSD